jgi:alpha-mannosidase
MRIRFRHVIDLAEQVRDNALEDLALSVSPEFDREGIPLVVFNPSPWERSGNTEVRIVPLAASPLGKRIFGYSVPERDFDPSDLVIRDDGGREIPFDVVKQEVSVLDILLRRKVLFEDTLRFRAEKVPPMGYRLYYARKEGKPHVTPGRGPVPQDLSIDNGLVRVTLDRHGLVTVEDLRLGLKVPGLNRFVDEADAGDEYSFSPLANPRDFSSADAEWDLSREGDALIARCVFRIPEELCTDRRFRSEELADCSLTTRITLQEGETLVRFRTIFDNRARDHRLRACFPTGINSGESIAETAFGLIHRPFTPEPCEGWREATSGNYVQRRFVMLREEGRGFVLFNRGLPEYEALPGGDLHLTLVRSVGWLSRDDLPRRPGQVGPGLPTPGAQCPGEQVFEYGVYLFSGNVEETPLFRIAEEFHHPLRTVAVQTSRPSFLKQFCTSFLTLDNPRIALSAFRLENRGPQPEGGKKYLLRLFNPSDTAETVTVHFAQPLLAAAQVSLGGTEYRKIETGSGGLVFSDTVEAQTIASYWCSLANIS